MNKTGLTSFFNNAKLNITKHSPEILTGIGIAGMITTTVLAVKATPKAMRLLEDRKCDLEEDELPATEVIKTTWKCYIPAAVTCALSLSCLIGASSVSLKRNAALATAYKLSETALIDYRDKVVETIGEKKEKEVREKVAKEKVTRDPITKKEIIITSKGTTICYDVISGRYFKSDMETLRRAENTINKMLINQMYISLNEFYDEIGLDHLKNGYELGWNIGKGLVEFDFSSTITDDGNPCLVIDYNVAPMYDYDMMG